MARVLWLSSWAIILVLVFVYVLPQRGALAESERQFVIATVSRGDTIWDIATRMARDDADIRRVVFDIRQANNLMTTTVMPGETLKIPRKWCR